MILQNDIMDNKNYGTKRKSMNKTRIITIAAAFAALSSMAADSRVEFRDCPKCDKRIKVDLAANKAYVTM